MPDRSIVKETYHRDFNVDRASMDEENRTVELAFSSETVVRQWFGDEILDHGPQSVQLDRLRNGGAVLVNHNHDDQIGVVASARVDDDRRGRAVIRFSKSNRGEEIFQDVRDGIRSLVSVGYRISKYDTTEREGQPDLVRVMSWEPYEVSVVSVPADPSVGVGRNAEQTAPNSQTDKVIKMPEVIEETREQEADKKPAFNPEKERQRLRTDETRRMDAIKGVADEFDLPELAREAISEGWSLEDFNKRALESVGERNNKARVNETRQVDVDLSRRDHSRFSFVRLMDALSNPNDRAAQNRAAFELEVCADAESSMPNGFNARGVYIPPSIISRDLTAGTATDGAELVATNLLAGEYISVLRNNMVALQAGARLLPGLVGNVDIPRQTSGAVATWISAEDGDAGNSDPQFDSVSLTPKDLAAYTQVSRRLTQQSSPAIEAIVRDDLFLALALGMDGAVYYGSGAAGQPQGIDGATGVDDPTLASATAPTYAELVTIEGTVAGANAIGPGTAWIVSAPTVSHAKTTSKQASGVEGNFIMDSAMGSAPGLVGSITGYNCFRSTQLVANDFVFGDFRNILIGEWGGIELNVDPYTNSLKGKTRYIIFKTCDIAIRHPSSFSFHNAA